MTVRPKYGKSCCEEAQLTANEAKAAHDNWMAAARRAEKAEAELARRNEELAEAEGEIAGQARNIKWWEAQNQRLQDIRRRAEAERDEARDLAGKNTAKWSEESAKVRELTAECGKLRRQCYAAIAERDDLRGRVEEVENERIELQDKLDAAEAERDRLEAKWNEAEKWADVYREERDDLKASLRELQPAENRPTLDREAVRSVIRGSKDRGDLATETYLVHEDELIDAIMELAPAEGWPEWLGPKIDPDECDLDSHIVAPGYGVKELRERVHHFAQKAGEAEAAARRREAMERDREQAATGDEDQRVEEQAKALYMAIGSNSTPWESLAEAGRERYCDVIRAGWTPPESEANQ